MSCVLGLIILGGFYFIQPCTKSQERERERERESDLEDLLSLSRRDEISQPNLACHEPLLHDTGKVDVACSRDMAGAEREHWSAVQQQH